MPIGSVIYLHGFASSPASTKAMRFRDELERRGIGFACPDFNEPAFETLTVTRMLNQTRAAIDAAPGEIGLIGSSLGAFVAVLAAARDDRRRIGRLLLLAPALDFGGDGVRKLGEFAAGMTAAGKPDADEWRRRGRLSFFHYAFNEPRDVQFALYEDALRYDAFAVDLPVPVLVFHGRQDDVVDPQMVRKWAAGRPNVDLRLVDDGHQLTASMDDIWRESERFFGLG